MLARRRLLPLVKLPACGRFRYAPGEQYGTMWPDSGCHFDVTHHVSVLEPPSRRPFERPPVTSPAEQADVPARIERYLDSGQRTSLRPRDQGP